MFLLHFDRSERIVSMQHISKKRLGFCGISHFTCTVGHRLLPMFANYESWWLAWRHELIIYCVGSSLNTAAKGCKKCCLYYFIYGRKVQAYCLKSLWRLGVLCVCDMFAMSTIPPTLVLGPFHSHVPCAGSEVSVHHRGQAPSGLPRGSFVLAASHSALYTDQWLPPLPRDSACRWNLTTTSTSSWNFWRGSLMTYRLQVISRRNH